MIVPGLKLEFGGGWLRPLTPEDVHAGYVNGLNDPEVNKYLVAVRQAAQTTASVTSFVSHSQTAADEILFGIWKDGADRHCGTIRLHGIEGQNRTALIGICLFDKRVWGQGLASKALVAVTKWAQSNLNLRWIEAGLYAANIASEKTFLSAGYEWIYDIPGKYLYDGVPVKVRIYAARSQKD